MVESARRAIADLEFVRVSDNHDAHKAALVARTVFDKKVGITLTNSCKKLTNIKIRVRLFGDEVLSFDHSRQAQGRTHCVRAEVRLVAAEMWDCNAGRGA